MATLATILQETTEQINIDNRKREKSPITYAIKDVASFAGSVSRFANLAMDDMVQDKVLENKLNSLTRLKEFEAELLSAGYSN